MKKNDVKVILVIGTMFSIAFLFSLYKQWKLKKHGVFVVAKIVDFEYGKSPSANCIFFLKGKRYDDSFKSFGLNLEAGQLIFLKVQLNNPTNNDALDFSDIKVPHCFSLSTTPENGWQELPTDSCK